jgi:hypothetical protein
MGAFDAEIGEEENESQPEFPEHERALRNFPVSANPIRCS